MSQIPEHLAPPLLPAKLPLLRPKQGRVIAGVARGISRHLGASVALVRIVFVLLACWFGVGALAYVALWIAIPEGNSVAEAARLRGTHSSRNAPLARGNASVGDPKARSSYPDTQLGTGCLVRLHRIGTVYRLSLCQELVRRTLATRTGHIRRNRRRAHRVAIRVERGDAILGKPDAADCAVFGGHGLPAEHARARNGQAWLTLVGEGLIFNRIPRVRGTDGRQDARRFGSAIACGFALLVAAICALIPLLMTLIRNIWQYARSKSVRRSGQT